MPDSTTIRTDDTLDAIMTQLARDAWASPQLPLPLPLDRAKLAAFLTQWLAIEAEEDRLRDEKRLLKEDYADDLPLRALLVAVKRVRAVRALEAHPKEPTSRADLAQYEAVVEHHLDAHEAATQQAIAEVEISARPDGGARVAVNIETGEMEP